MTNSEDVDRVREGLMALSRQLGDPNNDWAILAEGNTSAAVDADEFLLKASGSSLGRATPESFVRVRFDAVFALLEQPPASDEELAAALMGCLAEPGALRPSVEAALHGLALTIGGARYVGHTHPTAVNGVLCSVNPTALTDGALFPDQIVVCGPHPLFVPYVDPGIPLALEVRRRLLEHLDLYGAPPKAVYLQSHGLFALGQTADEVLRVTAMAAKTARILLGTFAAGGPRYLAASESQRIESREDEHYRRRVLARELGANISPLTAPDH